MSPVSLQEIWPLTFPVLQVCLISMWAEAVTLSDMLSPQSPQLSCLLATFLLLSCWKADGAHSGSEVVSSVHLTSVPSIVAKEGLTALIECNVTGVHDNFKWYNSKGPLQGDGAGKCWDYDQLWVLFMLHNCFIWKRWQEKTLTEEHTLNTK